MLWGLAELLPLLALVSVGHCFDWDSLDLPEDHLPFYFNNNPSVKKLCETEKDCPFKEAVSMKRCWGYEKNCPEEERLSNPTCPEPSRGWTKDKGSQLQEFWKGADFGYVLERRKEMKYMCAPENEEDSSLECAKYTRHCRAKNIYLDFREAKLNQGNERFREDVFKEGQIGGHCRLNKQALKAEGEHKSPLQSWFAEVENFSSLPFYPLRDNHCDIIIDKPTYFMKLDAGVNLFHHYCDFLNLYAAQHVNNSFSKDIYIIMWDTSPMPYGDLFADSWKAFTDHPIIRLSNYDGKRLCVRDAVFPLLPRMRWGMFYNMPLIPGCYGSSLFHAFSRHMMHRLHIPQHGPLPHKVRITVLARKTKYRNIMNEDELISAMKTVGEYEVQLVVYDRSMPFLRQVETSHNSDIFIGMHGAGLTHMLFQPDWGSVIELYSCEDPNCYFDLSRLRGLKYFTWEKKDKMIQEDEGHHPQLGPHTKFTNYAFDVDEFMKLVAKAADHVTSHPEFIAARELVTAESHQKEEL